MERKPILGIMLGDAGGVGPEIIAKLCVNGFLMKNCRPLLIGDYRILKRGFDIIGENIDIDLIDEIKDANWDKKIPMIDRKNLEPNKNQVGTKTIENGIACLDMLKLGIKYYKEGKIEGFCFAPFNKAAMKDAGCTYESEHHYLAHLLNHKAPFGEINVCENVWTTRTTSHIPISSVSENLTEISIGRAISLSDYTLKNAGIKTPRIAVAALNPHAGENGTCGKEEIDIIIPTIKKAKKNGINVDGPFPSDILFIKAFKGEFDGVVTMYHDQGQIALKLKGFDTGITIAGGFEPPIVTCGHGTAYDIAGKNIVKTSAFEKAVQMAVRMANAKRKPLPKIK